MALRSTSCLYMLASFFRTSLHPPEKFLFLYSRKWLQPILFRLFVFLLLQHHFYTILSVFPVWSNVAAIVSGVSVLTDAIFATLLVKHSFSWFAGLSAWAEWVVLEGFCYFFYSWLHWQTNISPARSRWGALDSLGLVFSEGRCGDRLSAMWPS